MSPSLFCDGLDEIAGCRSRATCATAGAASDDKRRRRRSRILNDLMDLSPDYPLDRRAIAEQGWPCHERRARHFGKSRSPRSTAASGRRCATAAAAAACTSSRMRRPGLLYPTNVACKLLDRRNGRCLDYKHRKKLRRRLREARPQESRRARLAARDLRLPLARRGRAAARLALSDLRKPRDGSRGGAIDARLDGQRGRRRASSNIMWSSGRSEAAAARPALPVPIEIRPIRSARRLRLRFDEASGVLKLTCPWRTSRAGGAGLGARPARLDRGAARARRAGRAVRAGRRSSRSKAATVRIWLGRRRAAHAAAAKATSCAAAAREHGFARRIEAFLQAPRARHACRARSPSSRPRAGVVARARSASAMPATRWGSCSSQGRIR